MSDVEETGTESFTRTRRDQIGVKSLENKVKASGEAGRESVLSSHSHDTVKSVTLEDSWERRG